jgi:heat shock protein HslJ
MLTPPSRFLPAAALLATLAVAACDQAGESQPLSPSATTLQGGEWSLTHLDGQPIDVASTAAVPTILFDDRGRLSGFAGCNRFSGTYDTTGERLRIGPLAMTRMACASGMDLEDRYARALQRAESYRGDALRLELAGAAGVVAEFGRRR